MTAPDNRYTPPADAFRDLYGTGWRYALHPVDKVDDPYRRRVTLLAPFTGEPFVDWIPATDAADELAGVGEAVDRALAWIDKRENPQPPCRFLLQRLPLGFAHGKQGGLF